MICNPMETRTKELVEHLLADKSFHIHQEQALSNFILRNRYLKNDEYQFYITSSVDILICDLMNKPLAAIEKQSVFHDNEKTKNKDQLKKSLCAEAGIPIIYVREKDGYLNFWANDTDGSRLSVRLNLYLHDNLIKIKNFLLYLIQSYSNETPDIHGDGSVISIDCEKRMA